MQKHANLVDLVKSFPTTLLQYFVLFTSKIWHRYSRERADPSLLIPTSNHPPLGHKYRSSNSTNVCAIFIGSMACRVHVLEVDRERVLFIDCDLNLAILPRVVNLVLLVSVFNFVVIVWIIWGPPTASEYIEFPSHRSVLPPRRRPRPRAGLRNVFFGRARRRFVGRGFFKVMGRDLGRK